MTSIFYAKRLWRLVIHSLAKEGWTNFIVADVAHLGKSNPSSILRYRKLCGHTISQLTRSLRSYVKRGIEIILLEVCLNQSKKGSCRH